MLLLALLVPWAAKAQNHLNEGFEASTFPPEEWRIINVSGSNTWVRNTSYKHSGSACASVSYNSSTGHDDYLVTPKLVPAANEALSYYVAAQSWAGTTLTIEISTTTPTTAGFTTTLATYTTGSSSSNYIGTNSNSTWVEKTIPAADLAAYVGQEIYIAFHVVDNDGSTIYVDDVTGVSLYVPSCAKPTGLAATLTPGDGTIATLNWTAGGEETAWVLEYGTTSDFTGATSVNVSGTPTKNLKDLTAETKYYARVKADCGGGDTSEWSTTCEFTPTDQLIISILGTTGSTSYYLPSNTNYDYAYTQQIYTAEEMGGFACTLQSVAFKGNKASVCNLDIYLANTDKSSFTSTSDYIAISEATLVFSGNVTFIADDWKTIEFDNEFDYTGGNLAVIVDDNSGNYDYYTTTWQTFNTTTAQALYFYQDDTNINPSSPSAGYSGTPSVKDQIKFIYELPSPYQKPKNLAVTNLTAATATITWEAPNSDVLSYKYQYQPDGGTWTELTSTTATSAPLTVLTGNTAYNFQVQAIYAGNNESAFASTSFTTECDPASIIPDGYSYGFEDESELDCWTVLNPIDNSDYGYQHQNWGETGIINNSDSYSFGSGYARTGDNCFLFTFTDYPDVDPQYQCLISPQITGIANGLHFEFYYRQYSNGVENFRVGYSTTDKNINSFTWGSPVENLTAEYQRFSANYPAGTKYVAIQHTSDDQYMIYIDDITFEEAASCLEPTGVTADNITTTGAEITWTNGGEETAWDIFVTTDQTIVPDELTTPTEAGITVKPHPLPSLTPATRYYVYVRSACSSTETSAWSTPYVFDTDCIAEDLPYSYGFENPDQYNICWNIINTNTSYLSIYLNTSSSNAHTGDNSLYYYRGSGTGTMIAVLPEFDANYPLNEYEITFWGKGSGTFAIGIMTDPDDASTFVQQGEDISLTGSYVQYLVRFNEYTGNGQYIGIKEVSTSNVGGSVIDDIAINHLPSCIEPDDLTVTSPTAHGATFGWTENGAATEWHLFISESNTAPDDDIDLGKVTVADSNPFTLTTGLDAETTYYVWVRANCGSTDGYSPWVGPETFTTTIACPAPTGLAASEITGHTAKLSWTGTSESYVLSVGTYDYTGTPVLGTIIEEGFEHSGSWPEGWTSIDEDGSGKGWYITSSTYYTGSYGAAAQYNSSAVPSDWLISPQIQFGGGSLSFYARKSSGTEQFQVYVSTTGKEISDFTAISEVEDVTTTYTKYEYDLSSYSGSGYVAIKHTGAIDQYWLYLDDITITGPTYPIAWDTYNTTDTQKTVEGLLAETPYFAKVKGNCGTEGFSQETEVVSFTTDVACPAPTGFAIEAVGSNYVLLNWNLGVDDAWQVELTDVTHGSAPSVIDVNAVDVTVNEGVVTFQINLTNPENEYSVRLRANCESAGDGYSEWTSPLAFTTIAACSAMDVTFDNITHHNVTVNWNGESDDDFTVYYRVAEQIDGISEDFSGTSVPSGWTVWSGLVDDVIDGSATLTTYNYGWSVVTSATNIFSSNHMKLNIYGSSVKYWLVTPEINLAANSGLSFDLALTAYASGGSGTSPVSGTNADDRFAVLIYANNAWTILREWNNSGSTYVYNDIATAGENVQIDLSSYTGTVKIAFYGESTVTVTGDDNDMHIDNVAIGVPVAVGPDQTQLAAGNTTDITSLTEGTKYEVRVVPNCNPSLGTAWTSFNTVAGNEKYFLTAGDWATTTNWMDGEIPTITDNAIILANVAVEDGEDASANNVTLQNSSVITTKNGGTLTIMGTVTGGSDDKIIIEEGGQFIHRKNISATVKKTITAPATWKGTSDSDGWYLIATPVDHTTISYAFTGVIDLFQYDEATAYWWSYNNGSHLFTSMDRDKGYLHASQNTQTVSYAGTMLTTEEAHHIVLNYTSSLGDDVRGFNLIGNPFTRNLVLGDMTIGGEPVTTLYVITDADRTKLTAVTTDAYAVKPGEGFFVQATATSQSLTLNPAAKDEFEFRYIKIVAGNENGSDNAYIQLENGNTLSKMNIANKTSVSVIDNGEDFAAATIYELAGSMPVNFKAVEDGNYTITVNAKNIEAHTMILVDSFTGVETDLLATPSYSFKATTNDEENRFKILFDFNNYTGIEENFTNEIFAYQYGSEIMVNGEGTLEVFDVMGRMVLNTRINGVERINVPANAVYIFKLNEKVQKIVVR